MSVAAANPYRYRQTIGMFVEFGRGMSNPYDDGGGWRDGRLFVLSRSKTSSACASASSPWTRTTLATGAHTGTDPDSSSGPIRWCSIRTASCWSAMSGATMCSVFSQDGTWLYSWGGPGTEDGRFNRAAGIAFDSAGNVIVVDAANHRLQKFDPQGRFVMKWGSFGNSGGQLNMPWGVAVDAADNVYVADWRNDRLQVFDAEGRYGDDRLVGHRDGEFRRPAGISIDRDGHIIVADWGNERVQILRPDGTHLATLLGDAPSPSGRGTSSRPARCGRQAPKCDRP